jgi:LPXTG-motif cell wall-anchored protein
LPTLEIELWRYAIPDDKWNEYINQQPSVDLKMQVKAKNWVDGYWWDETLSIKQNSTITITLTNQYGANGSGNIPELYYNDEPITFTKTNPKGTVYEWTASFIVKEGATLTGTLNWWNESDWTRSYKIEMAFPAIPQEDLLYYKESVAYDTIYLKSSNNWQYLWDELAQIGVDESENLIHYVYEVDEGFISGYTPTISSSFDKITGNYHYQIVNTKNKQELIVLPETGGAGTQTYISGGILLMLLAWVGLLYKKRITERRWRPPDS